MSQTQAQQEADARQAHRRWKAEYHGPDWAKKSLSDEGMDFVDDVIRKLNEYLQPCGSIRRVEKNPRQDPLVEMVTNWMQDKRTSQDGGPAIFSALFRYIMVDTVMKCSQREAEDRFPKLLGFMRFLVHDLDNGDILSQDQMREGILAIIRNDQSGPLHPRSGSDRRRREYFNLHAFCLDMYRDSIMRNMVVAKFALDTYFNQGKADLTSCSFANQWLLNAAEDIYRSVDNAKDDWLYWTFMLMLKNKELGLEVYSLPPSVNEYYVVDNSAPARMAELKALPVGSDDPTIIRMLRGNATRQLEHATSDKRRRELRDQIAALSLAEDDINESETEPVERQREE